MIEKLACNLDRKDEQPNIDLAKEIAALKGKGVQEIVVGLNSDNQDVANDCIKVLYELADIQPEYIAPHAEQFISLLKSRNNRLVWGAMIALSKIAHLVPQLLFANLDLLISIYEKGSVITVDNAISIFAAVCKASPEYERKVFPLLIHHIEHCRLKEVGQHAERITVCISKSNAEPFKKALETRYVDLTDAQKKRVDSVLRKVTY